MKVLLAELHLALRFLTDALQHLQFLAQCQFPFAARLQLFLNGLAFLCRSVESIYLSQEFYLLIATDT